MSHISNRQNVLDNTADATAMRLFVLLVVLVMCCSGVFGQQARSEKAIVDTDIKIVAVSGENHVAEAGFTDSQMELVNWFMGSKQSTPAGETAKTSTTSTTTKKQFINSGMTPNRILSRTLLKKAMQYENNIV